MRDPQNYHESELTLTKLEWAQIAGMKVKSHHILPATPVECSGSNIDFDIQQITLNNLSTTSYVTLGNDNSLNIKEFLY